VVFLFALAALAGFDPVATADSPAPKPAHMRGDLPDFIELFKELNPMVVNISIERHMVQNSSSESPTLFRSRSGRLEERLRGRDRTQSDSVGSGFFCDSVGHIVTSAHVVDGATKILVILTSGKTVAAKVVAVHPKVDLALLKITPPYPLPKARLGDSAGVQVGEWVLTIGNPYGLGSTLTKGIVSAKGRFLGLGPDDDFIQTDAPINPGNSGGPLFNLSGEVIGVNTAVIGEGKGIGFAIPSNYVAELMAIPSGPDSLPRGWLGIYVEDVTARQAEELGLNPVHGTFVDEVLTSTPAYEAGLRKGDLILDAGGKAVRDGRHLSRIIADAKPGEMLQMTVLRESKTHTVDVVVGKSPE
jgi:serine protease Do